ncbi:MAG: phosphoribosylglycinamide formyltransferase [Phycisphaerae bacterium]|nr:phosphoribosylglycinamide formyltransferase [Phycisphaerae bacterium]
MSAFNVAVFASGRGRTLQNLLEHITQKSLSIEVKALVTHRPCAAIEVAKSNNIPVHIIDEADSKACHDLLQELKADLAVLAGWIKPFPVPAPISAINIHPSLLPKFGGPGMYGKHVHAAVIASGETRSGCTIHLVTEKYDEGPILSQMEVQVHPGDSAEILANRVFNAECRLLPETLASLAEGRIELPERARGIR